ncbi:MCP four helix bundle domain-containing protein, partial [Desulfovibrio sp. 1188_IL3213]|uniref:HAMP domain-containing protein n=2 Tax=unclassified Desulfovibrio TaxID=2593640 RepID=UPI002FDB54A9
MNFFSNLKVGTKITALIALLLLCMAGIAFWGIRQLNLVSDEADNMYFIDLQGLEYANAANIDMLAAVRELYNVIIFPPDVRPGYVQNYNRYADQTAEALKKAEPLITDANNRLLLQKLQQAFAVMDSGYKDLIKKADTASEEHLLADLVRMREQVNNVESMMGDLGAAMMGEAERRAAETTTVYEHGRLYSLVLLGLALVFGALYGLATKRGIANPLVAIAGKATQVADGDLDQDFSLKRADEIGQLADALARMVDNLR